MSYLETNSAINTTFDPSGLSPDITSTDVQDAIEDLKAYIDSEISASEGLCCVIDKDLTAPPGSPTTGDQYIVASVATGLWATHEEKLATWSGTAWVFTLPSHGQQAFVQDEDELYLYTGGSHPAGTWTKLTSTLDHSDLASFGTDDHSEYSLADGTRDYTANIGTTAATPADADHLTRKDYVEAGHEAIRTEVGTSYTATSTDQVILIDHTAPFTLNLPVATDGKVFSIKDISAGGASADSITIDGNASETVDGSTTFVISSDKTALRLVGVSGSGWYLV